MNRSDAPPPPPKGVGGPKRGLAHRALGGFFWTIFSAVAQAGSQLIVLIVLARMLPPSSFGLAQAALVVVGFSAIFSQLGVGPAVVQRPRLEPRHIRTGFTLSVLFGAGVSGLIWAVAPLMAGFFRMPELTGVVRWMSLALLFQGTGVVAESLLQRELLFRRLSLIEVGAFAGGFGGVGIGMAYLGFGVWSLVGAHLAQNLIKTSALVLAQPHPKRPLVERAAFRDLMYFGGGFTVARIGNYIAGQGDSLVVGRWLGAEALGFYGRAYQLMTQPAVLFGQSVDRVLFPAMAKFQHDAKRLRLAYRRGVALIALTTLPAGAVMCILAPELIAVLLGPRWVKVILPFQILALGLLFRTSYKMSDSIARATGAVYRRAWRQGVFAAAVTGGAWIGHHWGVAGVAVGVLLAIALNFLIMAQLSLSLSEMSWGQFWAAHLPAVGLTAIVGAQVWGMATLLRNHEIVPIMILVLSGGSLLLTGPLLYRFLPHLVLGRDGEWMIEQLASYLPASLRPFFIARGPSKP